MSDSSDVFYELVQRQRVFDAAHDDLVTARGVTDEEREALRAAERQAALALYRCRQAHPEWAPWDKQQEVLKAARIMVPYSPEWWQQIMAEAWARYGPAAAPSTRG